MTGVSDDKPLFDNLFRECNFLKSEIFKMVEDKKNLVMAIKHNEDTSSSLNELKRELEFFKSHLCKKLFRLKISADIRKIAQGKKLNELNHKNRMLQECYKQMPFIAELKSLKNENTHLEEELRNEIELFELTKTDLKEFRSSLEEDFQRDVCELAELILKLKL